ncbi:MAG: phosphonate ABC transporter, permease protein PhnE [Planctomycetota bacterium]
MIERFAENYRRRWNRSAVRVGAVLVVVTACAAVIGFFDVPRYIHGAGEMARVLGEALPPDFTNIADWGVPLLDTLAMSIVGTAMAVVVSLALGFLAARNTSPHPAVYHATRTFLNLMRAIPELIMGILLVVAVGFGALPGALALGFHSLGMVGKFFAESIEHVTEEPIEAARAAGGRPLQVVTHGVLPQVLPQMADVAIYRWEYNFRASTVLGMIGAGGIGFELMASLRIMEYREVSAILILILAMVTVVDTFSGWMRRKFK